MLVGRTDWRIKRGKAEPTRVVAQCFEHRLRYAMALQARRHHDFERADSGGPEALQPVAMGPADHLVPAPIGQRFTSARRIGEGERHAEGSRYRPVGLGGVNSDQPGLQKAVEITVVIIECRCRVVTHELGYGRLDLCLEYPGPNLGALGKGGDSEPAPREFDDGHLLPPAHWLTSRPVSSSGP